MRTRLRSFLRAAHRAALNPAALPSGLILPLALLPPIAAGLVLFRIDAARLLGIGLGAALVGYTAKRLLRLPEASAAFVAPLVAVGMVGPGCNLLLAAVIAAAAGLLEIVRAWLLPAARLQTGLLAYSIGYAASSGAVAAYLRPVELSATPDPITLWQRFFSANAAPIDPIRLYVGNVSGPVFATSLLAVAVSVAWLWYTRRLRLSMPAGFLAGGLAVALALHWNAVFQLDSGPSWFVVAVLLADRAQLRHSGAAQVLMGLIVGIAAVALRARGHGIELVAMAAVGVQLVVMLTEGGEWLVVHRHEVLRGVARAIGAVNRVVGAPVRALRGRRANSAAS